MKIAGLLVAFLVLAAPHGVHAQSNDRSLAFEVASVKPNKGDGPTDTAIQPGGRLTMTNVPLRLLLRMAYQVQDDQIVDAPPWIAAEHFDILAKASADTPVPAPGQPGPLLPMLRTLLADRFKLAVRHEMREAPAYALVRLRRDGSLGQALRRSTTDCAAVAAARAPNDSPQVSNLPRCGIRATGGRMIAGGQSLSQIAAVLSQIVRRTVMDRTELAGAFDFELNWTPELVGQSPPDAAPPQPADAPSIFTALQEQLGLRLEAVKVPIDVLVIDHVERPSPD